MAEDCKICKVLAKPGDLCRVLNQGLYHKYTSSQDYFYTRDINALLLKKRKPFCIKYYDDLVYDESKERLKGFFRKKDSISLMHEIKQFYTKFQNFPRNFHTHFFNIINSNIRKHRRLEYIRVFNNVDLDEDKGDEENGDQKDPKPPKDECEFNFMELLGDSFLQDNYKDHSNVIIGGIRLEQKRTSEQLMQEVEVNFRALYKIPKNTINDPSSETFSNALYNKNYMLYSRNDSETAEDMLKQIVNEFREVDFSRKASVSLAEKVLQQPSLGFGNPRKMETRNSPTIKRAPSTLDLSPNAQTSKKSLGASNFSTATNQQVQKQVIQPLTSSHRGLSNLRASAQLEIESPSILGKSAQSQSKGNGKISVEQLNDLGLNRNKILSKLYQFRSTRSKSGGLKSVVPINKSSSSKTRRPMGLHVDTQGLDTTDPKQVQTAYYINHHQSQSPSPDRNNSKDESEKGYNVDTVLQAKTTLDSPYYNSIKRSISNGRNIDLKEIGSPTNQDNRHKKSSSVIKRTAAPPKQHVVNPSGQNFTNNSSYVNNASGTTQDNASSPQLKFVNPLRTTLGGSQVYNVRHQSPLEERIGGISSDKAIKSINIRSLKNTSPTRIDYRVATMSLSGRHQNLSDLSQGIHSLLTSQAPVQMLKNNSQPMQRKNEGQPFAAKVTKRASAVQGQMLSPSEEIGERERRTKKILELNEAAYNSFKDPKNQSKEQTPSNYMPSSTTSLNKFKVEVKKNVLGSYTVKGSSKDIKFSLKKT